MFRFVYWDMLFKCTFYCRRKAGPGYPSVCFSLSSPSMASADTICKMKLNWWVGNIPFSHLSRSLRHSSNLCLTIQCFTAVPRFKSSNGAMLRRHREKLDTLEQASYPGMQPLPLFSVLMLLKAWARTLLCTPRRHGKEEVKWRDVTWPQKEESTDPAVYVESKVTGCTLPFRGTIHERWLRGGRTKIGGQAGPEAASRFPFGWREFKTGTVYGTVKAMSATELFNLSKFDFFFFKKKSFEWICTERQGLVLPL